MNVPIGHDAVIWIGIGLCLVHSAMFSGLNLAVFGVSRLVLETEKATGNRRAARVFALRQDAHFLLTTILWGNVAANVLLAILSDSILTGLGAFLFSTFVITLVGEIFPQAYFSRNALKVASAMAPILRFYQFVLYPVARPTALILDAWMGPENVQYLRERTLRHVLQKHIDADETDIERTEGMGALNFLELDDLPISTEGERIDPLSIVSLLTRDGLPVFPSFSGEPRDLFLDQVQRSGKKWVIFTDEDDQPRLVINANSFLRDALFARKTVDPLLHCHRPIVITDPSVLLGDVLPRFRVRPEHPEDDVIDEDIILVWAEEERRIITGSDILGHLMRGIVRKGKPPGPAPSAR